MTSSVFGSVKNKVFSQVFKSSFDNPFGDLPWYQQGLAAINIEGYVVYPKWVLDGVNKRYANSNSVGLVSQVPFNQLLTSFSRSSTATYFDASGTIQTAAINEPRFTHKYNQTSGKWEPAGLLLEDVFTNNMWFTEDVTQSQWSFVNTDKGTKQSDGAVHIFDTSSSSSHFWTASGSVASGSNYVCWCVFSPAEHEWVQMSGLYASFGSNMWVNCHLSGNGSIGYKGSAVISAGCDLIGYSSLGKPMYLCYIVAPCVGNSFNSSFVWFLLNNTNVNTRANSYSGNGNGVYYYRGNFGVGTYPTSYVYAEGSSVTRSQDKCLTNVSNVGLSNGYTIVESGGNFNSTNAYGRIIQLDNGNTANKQRIYHDNAMNYFAAEIQASNVSQGWNNLGTSPVSSAYAVGSNYFQSASTEVGLSTVDSNVTYIAPNLLSLNSDTEYNNATSGTFKKVLIYPGILKPTELQRILTL